MDKFVIKDGKKLRCGYTTGTCAAASAKACVLYLENKDINKEKIRYVDITSLNNIDLKINIEKFEDNKDYVLATVIKDAGDDPDITDGMEIGVKVSKRNDDKIEITGGVGIGIVRRKGLFSEVGEYAINPGPKKLITKSIREASNRGYNVEIFAPRGVEVGLNTYNKNIGIEGGISILGSTGIVEPMSEDALVKTIFMEIDGRLLDNETLLLFPGNYGKDIAESLNLSLEGVKVSNFIGEAVSYAVSRGAKKIILVGHIGKFSKLSLGAFQTHNRTCDLRMEAFVYYLALRGAPLEMLKEINECLTAEEAVEKIIKTDYKIIFEDMRQGIINRLRKYVKKDDFLFEVHFYSMEKGVLKCYI